MIHSKTSKAMRGIQTLQNVWSLGPIKKTSGNAAFYKKILETTNAMLKLQNGNNLKNKFVIKFVVHKKRFQKNKYQKIKNANLNRNSKKFKQNENAKQKINSRSVLNFSPNNINEIQKFLSCGLTMPINDNESFKNFKNAPDVVKCVISWSGKKNFGQCSFQNKYWKQ